MAASVNINTEGPLNLMVAWGVGGKVHGRTINVGGGVADALRDAAQQTVASMDSGHPQGQFKVDSVVTGVTWA